MMQHHLILAMYITDIDMPLDMAQNTALSNLSSVMKDLYRSLDFAYIVSFDNKTLV